MSDESVEPVQPDQGQGGDGTGGAPYQEYLDRIPENLRGDVEPVFKDWDANTTRRFQEHAETGKRWEPFQESGIDQHDPELVKWLANFGGALSNNPQAVWEWAQQYAQENGITVQQAVEEAGQDSSEFEFEDPAAQFEQKLTPLAEKMQKFEQWMEQQETQAATQQAQAFIDSQIEKLKTDHPAEFDDLAQKAVEQLVAQYIETDPRNAVPKAWADWQNIRNTLEKNYVQGKADDGKGGPALTGGVPDVTADEPKSMQERHALAKDWIRSNIASTQ